MALKKILIGFCALLLVFLLAATDCQEKVKCAVDGKEMSKSEAKITHQFENRTYYFCCQECKQEFLKNPHNYLKESCQEKEAQAEKQKMEEKEPPYICRRSELTVENLEDGVVIKITSKDPAKVKEIHEFAAKMVKEREAHQKKEEK